MRMLPAMRMIGMLCLVLAAGCAGVEQAPVDARAQGGPLLVDPSLLGRNQDMSAGYASRRAEAQEEAPVALAQPIAAAQQPVVTRSEIAANEPSAATSAPPARSVNTAGAAAAPAKAPASVPAAAAAIEPPPKTQAPPPLAEKPEPPLDVEALKARLRDTNAIGLFTKLALKNQVDDLLQQFRAHYLGGQKTSVAALRQAYDMLVLKVLALIQDSDPSLARTISGSREAIWGILADPKKFSSVS